MRDSLRGEVDDALRERADLPQVLPRLVIPRPLPPAPFGGAPGFFQIVSADGEIARPRGSTPVASAGGRASGRVARGDEGEFLADARVNGVHLRVLTTPLPAGLALQIARPLDEVDSVLSRLRLLLVLVSLAGIALAARARTRSSRARLSRRCGGCSRRPRRSRRPATRRAASRPPGGTSSRGSARRSTRCSRRSSGRSAAQRQLVADASHELRTPLTSLRTNVELLASGRLEAEATGPLRSTRPARRSRS